MAIVVGALAWYAVAMASTLRKSGSIDEFPHLAAGLAVLEYGDFRVNPEHPPLVKVLAALPPYLFYRPDLGVQRRNEHVVPWVEGRGSEFGYFVLFHGGRDPQRLLLLGRLMPALFGLLGAVFAFLWGREMSGRCAGGALAAVMLLLYPEYTGHARLVTLDVPALAGCAAVSWFGWRWWRRPDWRRASVFVATSAIGSQIKLPVITFTVFLFLVMGFLMLLRRRRGLFRKYVAVALATIVAGYIAFWAGAGFRFSYHPDSVAPTVRQVTNMPPAQGSRALDKVVNWAWRNKLLPESALGVIIAAGSFAGRDMYMFREHSTKGWYHYFLVTMGVKTPVLMLAGFAAAGVWAALRTRGRKHGRRQVRFVLHRAAFLGVPFAALFVLYILQKPNIGHRQILFVYFPLCVLLGVGLDAALRHRLARWFAYACVAGQVLAFAVTYPHYETYFNEIVRTPLHGAEIVEDSNVDWGTDVPLLADVLRELGSPPINLALFGYNRPESYGIAEFSWILPSYPWTMYMRDYEPPDPQRVTAVSLNTLKAVRHFYPELCGREPDVLLNSIVLFLPPGVRR